jgi:hypothetical protein
MKKMVAIVGFLIGWLMAPLSAEELPHHKELMVVGTAEVVEGNVGRAREDAILTALKESVRIALQEFVPSTVLEENAFVLDAEIFSRVTQYVETFKILSETGRRHGHEVLLQAQVDLHKLKNSLAAMGLLEGRSTEEEIVHLRMILGEVSRYPWYREFEDFLREDLDFVRSVSLRSVMMGEFTMEIELIGEIHPLLDAVKMREFEGFSVEITQAFEDQVTVRFKPREIPGS